MSRRNPMNARYQDKTKVPGSTRRSASSAKPKRVAGSTSSGAKKKGSGTKRTFRERLAEGQTPEMRRWRRIWWVLIVAALGAALFTLLPQVRYPNPLFWPVTVVYLAGLGGALYIDVVIIRKLRAEAKAAEKQSKKSR